MQELYVNTADQLATLCTRLHGSDFIALDTEFVRERSYYPRLSLLQVATSEVAACVDILALDSAESLTPLLDWIYQPELVKVLHASWQDLEIFHLLRGRPPAPLFDTQIAAALLGQGDQLGYAALVESLLDIRLAKAHTRTDWCQRPLEPAQIRYALDDVVHLPALYYRLREQLRERNREHWLHEDCARLCQPGVFEPEFESLWQRVRGMQYLTRAQLATLRALAIWRERCAQRTDRPRRWILPDAVLIELARRAPQSEADLIAVPGLKPHQRHRYGGSLLKVIARALAEDAADWPPHPDEKRLEPAQAARVQQLMAGVAQTARQQNLASSILASRSMLERLVRGERDLPICSGWRAELLGPSLHLPPEALAKCARRA